MQLLAPRWRVARVVASNLSDDVRDHLALIRVEAVTHARTAGAAIALAVAGFIGGVLAAVSLSVLLVVLAWDEPYRNAVAIGVFAFWLCLSVLMTMLSIRALRRLRHPFRVSRALLQDDLGLLRELLRKAQP